NRSGTLPAIWLIEGNRPRAIGLVKFRKAASSSGMRRRLSRLLLTVVSLMILFTGLPGCSSFITGGQTLRDKQVPGLRVSREQLRMQARAQINPITGNVIDTANRIMAESDDPEVQFAALRWKAIAVPLYREALFSPQPHIAIIDALGLSYQMMDYFKTGEGAREFKEFAPLGFACAERNAAELSEFMDYVADPNYTERTADAAEVRALVREWADEYPIEGGLESRSSIYSEASEITLELGLTLGEAVDSVVTSMDDLNYKLDILSAQLPDQARWEVELAAREALNDASLREVLENAGPVLIETRTTLEHARQTMETLPDLVSEERVLVIKELERQLDLSIATLQREREILLNALTAEREAVMREVAQNREAFTADLREEIDSLADLVATQRTGIVTDIDVMCTKLVDDAFNRIYLLLGLIGLYITAMIFLVLWILDRRGRRQRVPVS
ncbi:MAG: hypothetical protein ACQKBV_13565, partial [Puniceicoccales bacterium]